MANELAIIPSIDEIKSMQVLADVFMRSGALPNNKNIAELVLKIQAGKEIGLQPFAAVNGIDFISGHRSFRAALVAAKVNESGRYRYRIVESTDLLCRLDWFEREDGKWDLIGQSQFTIDEAKQAGLTSKNVWKSYPSDMLFARALTRGCRRFCPDVFGGAPIYTREELENVDAELGDISDDLSGLTYDDFVAKVKSDVDETLTKEVITNLLKDGNFGGWKTSSKRLMFDYISNRISKNKEAEDIDFKVSED